MAIRIRRGNQIDFDKNKLVQGELAIVLDAGELHFCYGAGNTKRLATKEDLQQMLDMSETSYSALVQLIADLETNPNELTNILNNISALQSGKIDKSSIVQADTINDTTKVPSSAVTYALGQEIDTLNNNLADIDSQLAEKAKQHWIDVTDGKYGAKGDGITDDTEAFAKAIADITDNTILYIPPKKYLVTPSLSGGLSINSKNNFIVIGYGATIFCNPVLVTTTTPSFRLIRIDNCSNFAVKGIHFKYQVDWASQPESGTNRLDQIFQIYADNGQKCENFDISENTYEYYGPSFNDVSSGVNNKLTVLGIGSLYSDGNYNHNIKNFSVHNNTFVNCLGRTIYCLLTDTGVISGNKFKEFGKFVKPDESMKYYAESVGIRVLASKNVEVTGNTISCYSGDLLNGVDHGSIHAFEISSGGLSGQKSENINITGNTVNFYKCGAWFFNIGACDQVTFSNNNVTATDETGLSNYGIRTHEGVVKNVVISDNNMKNLRTFYYFDQLTDADYANIIIKNNNHFWGSVNSLTAYSSSMSVRAKIEMNYWSDKGVNCKGFNRIREISAYRLPPLTGSYTSGDICYNTGYNEDSCPVISWVYSRVSNGENLWQIKESTVKVGSTRPTFPSNTSNEKAQFKGLQWIDTSIGGNGRFSIYNGVNWMLADGTTI